MEDFILLCCSSAYHILFLGCVVLTAFTIQDADGFYCLECDAVSQPRHCHTVKECPEYYSCMVERYLSVNGEHLFNVGCKLNSSCSAHRDNIVYYKRSNLHPEKKICEMCCDGNLCNAGGCGEPGYPEDRGPACFNCMQRSRQDLCESVRICDKDQVCIVSTEVEFGDITYTSHCESSHICQALLGSPISVGKRSLPQPSTNCCSSDLCNNGMMVSPTQTAPTATTDQRGTEFVLAFPENYGRLDHINLYIVSTEKMFSGNVTSPVSGVSQNFSTSTGNVTISSLPSSLEVHDGISYKAVFITTDKPVYVYGFEISGCCIGEAFYVLPTKFLGMHYTVLTEKPKFNSVLSIVGTSNRTSVSVKLKSSRSVFFEGTTYNNGNTITFSLNRAETAEILSKADISGTKIFSTRPVAVLSGNTCAEISGSSACNQLVEYLQPTSRCGNRFIIPPMDGDRTNSKILLVTATVDGTGLVITGGGSFINKTVNTGMKDTTKLKMYEAYAVVSTKKVCIIIAAVVGHSTKDPLLTQIPSLDQYSNEVVLPRPTVHVYSNYLSMMVKSSSLSNLRINGNVIRHNDLKRVSMINTEYTTFWTNLENATSIYRVNSVSPDDYFGVIAYGQKKDMAYGYPVV